MIDNNQSKSIRHKKTPSEMSVFFIPPQRASAIGEGGQRS